MAYALLRPIASTKLRVMLEEPEVLDESMDRLYLDRWSTCLGVAESLAELAQ